MSKTIQIEIPDWVDERKVKELIEEIIITFRTKQMDKKKVIRETFGILKGKNLMKVLKEVENEWGLY